MINIGRFCLISILLLACTSHGNRFENHVLITNYSRQKINNCGSNKIVLVGGCFDVLHYGHFEFLKRAKEQAEYLVVALEPDETISKYKNRQPVHNQIQRATNLAAIRYVDEILLLPSMKGYVDYLKLVKDICPSVIAITKNDSQMVNKQKQAKEIGAQVKIVVPHLEGLSSSSIIKKYKNNHS